MLWERGGWVSVWRWEEQLRGEVLGCMVGGERRASNGLRPIVVRNEYCSAGK